MNTAYIYVSVDTHPEIRMMIEISVLAQNEHIQRTLLQIQVFTDPP